MSLEREIGREKGARERRRGIDFCVSWGVLTRTDYRSLPNPRSSFANVEGSREGETSTEDGQSGGLNAMAGYSRAPEDGRGAERTVVVVTHQPPPPGAGQGRRGQFRRPHSAPRRARSLLPSLPVHTRAPVRRAAALSVHDPRTRSLLRVSRERRASSSSRPRSATGFWDGRRLARLGARSGPLLGFRRDTFSSL